MTTLITPEQRAQLLANGAAYGNDGNYDPAPVVKLFTPDAAYTWRNCSPPYSGGSHNSLSGQRGP